MAITYKDISLLTNKTTPAGTEKIPVSDTRYLTTAQIAGLAGNNIAYIGPQEGTATYVSGGTIIDVSTKEDKADKVTSLSAASTDTQYPSAKCVYDLVGDIETLLAAI